MSDLGDPATLLRAWEDAANAAPAARGAVLVRHAGLAPDIEAALDLPLGECAGRAIRAHSSTFGPTITGVIDCPGCGATLECDVDLRATDVAGDDVASVVGRERTLLVRAPTTRDLLAAAGTDDAVAELLVRCVRETDGRALAEELDATEALLVDREAERLAGPAAQVLRTDCPACGIGVSAALDPGWLLWEQVDATAPRLLADVATLASAFGWNEETVFALSAVRRQAYLELAAR